MGMKSATAPWNTLGAPRKARSRKESAEPSGPGGCVWPDPAGTCREQRELGLALCASHAETLSRASGRCAWPGCTQSSFHALCTYHDKQARGLIEGRKGR
jgi:hypothetical protein